MLPHTQHRMTSTGSGGPNDDSALDIWDHWRFCEYLEGRWRPEVIREETRREFKAAVSSPGRLAAVRKYYTNLKRNQHRKGYRDHGDVDVTQLFGHQETTFND